MQINLFSDHELSELARPEPAMSSELHVAWRKARRKMKVVVRKLRRKISDTFQVRQLSLHDLLTLPESELGEVVWTEDDIDILREQILHEACHTLIDGRASLATRKERWAWILSDDLGPFTFRTCAQAAGVHWSELRDSLESLCRRAKVFHQFAA